MKKFLSSFRLYHFVLGISVIVILFAFVSCKKLSVRSENEGLKPTPTNPWLPSEPYSYANGDNNLATLGRVLFYDKNLSKDRSVSCGSCHQQAYGFADNKALSIGFNGEQTPRNAHTIMQTNNSHFWDGKNQLDFSNFSNSCSGYSCQGNSSSFNSPVSVPFKTHAEMNMDMTELCSRLAAISYYSYLFTKAGNIAMSEQNIELALGTFMSNISNSNSKFEKVQAGQAVFTDEELNGYAIFNGKGKCNSCHIETNGFGGNPGQFEDIGLDAVYTDLGRGAVTFSNGDKGRFHVPSLKNISLTAPYMHDGRFRSLGDVVDFFDSGVHASQNLSSALTDNTDTDGKGGFLPVSAQYPSSVMPPHTLGLTQTEKTNLVSFLGTLSDPTITSDIRFSDPFKH